LLAGAYSGRRRWPCSLTGSKADTCMLPRRTLPSRAPRATRSARPWARRSRGTSQQSKSETRTAAALDRAVRRRLDTAAAIRSAKTELATAKADRGQWLASALLAAGPRRSSRSRRPRRRKTARRSGWCRNGAAQASPRSRAPTGMGGGLRERAVAMLAAAPAVVAVLKRVETLMRAHVRPVASNGLSPNTPGCPSRSAARARHDGFARGERNKRDRRKVRVRALPVRARAARDQCRCRLWRERGCDTDRFLYSPPQGSGCRNGRVTDRASWRGSETAAGPGKAATQFDKSSPSGRPHRYPGSAARDRDDNAIGNRVRIASCSRRLRCKRLLSEGKRPQLIHPWRRSLPGKRANRGALNYSPKG
jgi:hypothetical protein